MADITWTVDDRPIRYFQLYRLYNETVYDLSDSGVVVTAKFRARGDTDESLWEATCTKVKAEQGIVSVQVPASGLDVDPGSYELEFTVTDNSLPETVLDIITVRVNQEFPDA